jgi:hypothetical protein
MVAQNRFQRLDASHLLAEVYEGTRYTDGQRRQESNEEKKAAA